MKKLAKRTKGPSVLTWAGVRTKRRPRAAKRNDSPQSDAVRLSPTKGTRTEKMFLLVAVVACVK